MEDSPPNQEAKSNEDFQIPAFPTLWVVGLGAVSSGLSLTAWFFFLTHSFPRLSPGVELSAVSLFLGCVVLGLSKGNSIRARLLTYLGITLSSIYFLNLLSHLLIALLLILTGDVPTPPSPG